MFPTPKPLALVSGALAHKPGNGGNAWTRLVWAAGLRRLGYDVWFVEEIGHGALVDMAGRPAELDASANLAFFRAVTTGYGFAERAALIVVGENGERVIRGADWRTLEAAARRAVLLVNLSGHLTVPELRDAGACRIYLDDDPGYTQFWHADGIGARVEDHDVHFTLGLNIGSEECAIPTSGIRWRPVRPPVNLGYWSGAPLSGNGRFTTVASWRGAYGALERQGRRYGQKAHEFRKVATLPRRTDATFEIALQIHAGDQRDADLLVSEGWNLVDPISACGTPARFREYVRGSAAEFSVAQGIYVETRSGWFSDRTARYLASGRPAVVQDTGFSRHLPTGEGLLAFQTPEEAVDAVQRVRREPGRHAAAARRIAAEYFDSELILRGVLRESGLDEPLPPAAAGGQAMMTSR